MGRSSVFAGDNGKLYLVVCPKCGKENYGMAVSSGQCCWCDYKAGAEDVTPPATKDNNSGEM